MNRGIIVLTLALQIVCVSSVFSQAQKAKHTLAETYFKEMRMHDAASIYKDILKKNPQDEVALRQAGLIQKNIGDIEQSERYYRQLVSLNSREVDDYLLFAEVLKMRGKYDEAIQNYSEYLKLKPEDNRVKEYVANSNWTFKIMRDSMLYSLHNSKINSPESDFAPCFVEDKLIFASARAKGKGKKNIYAWNDQSYLNLYNSEIVEKDSSLRRPEVWENKANSRFHEGTATYNAAETMMYFTRNNYNKGKKSKSKSGNLNLGIFYSKLESGEPGKLIDFEHNNPEYSVGHPSLSADGKTMYFVSNMPGGHGGTDIYKCDKTESGWAKPMNVGPEINTPGNEMFPFILGVDSLYFASNGHAGLGGLDNYLFLDGEIQNLGYPVNSSYDDMSMVVYEGGEIGYFSSNRPGGKGDDDIYEFKVTVPEIIIVSGKVLDELTMESLPGTEIYLKDLETGLLGEPLAVADSDGKYSVELPYVKNYTLVAKAPDYADSELELKSSVTSGFIDDADFIMKAIDYSVDGHVLLADDGAMVEGALLELKDFDNNALETITTSENGEFFFALEADRVYTLKCSKEGYPDQEVVLDTKQKAEKEFHTDFKLFKLEQGTVVEMDNIYYDYNRATIRSEAALELNKLVKIMVDNPTMDIKLNSHTDSRGPSGYNMSLSKKRAKAVVDYLVDKGISKSRLKSKGYGETKLKNKCKDGIECTEDEHQENRRTEFVIEDV